jgi:hypothetical protein
LDYSQSGPQYFSFAKVNEPRISLNWLAAYKTTTVTIDKFFGILQSNFRNDMAFAMAEKILHGYTLPEYTRMPWGITTVDAPVQQIDINQDWMVVRTEHGADVLPRQDLHVQSKAWLQSSGFDQFLSKARQ